MAEATGGVNPQAGSGSEAARPQAGDDTTAECWYVVDYSGRRLPGEWPTRDEAIDKGVCGKYLLSGMDVRKDAS